MNSLTSKQIKSYMAEFSPQNNGYVLNLTRAEFEDLVDDLDIDMSQLTGSNGKRLKHLLETCTNEQVESLVAALRAI